MIQCLHEFKYLKQMVFKNHYGLMKAFNSKKSLMSIQRIYYKFQEISHHFPNLPIVVEAVISVFSKLKRMFLEIIEA